MERREFHVAENEWLWFPASEIRKGMFYVLAEKWELGGQKPALREGK